MRSIRFGRTTSLGLAALALSGASLLSPAMTGAAQAATCSASGGYGADPYKVAGTVVGYGLIAFVDMPGCTTGAIDLEATAVPGTPGTCTLVLPAAPGLGENAGCGIVYAPSGAALASSTMEIVANGFAASASNVVPLVGTCTGRTLGSGMFGPRCSL